MAIQKRMKTTIQENLKIQYVMKKGNKINTSTKKKVKDLPSTGKKS